MVNVMLGCMIRYINEHKIEDDKQKPGPTFFGKRATILQAP